MRQVARCDDALSGFRFGALELIEVPGIQLLAEFAAVSGTLVWLDAKKIFDEVPDDAFDDLALSQLVLGEFAIAELPFVEIAIAGERMWRG